MLNITTNMSQLLTSKNSCRKVICKRQYNKLGRSFLLNPLLIKEITIKNLIKKTHKSEHICRIRDMFTLRKFLTILS